MTHDPDDILEMSQWDHFWVPGDVRVTDRPELLYYSCSRDVPILNTVTRTRAEPQRLPELIGEVMHAHRGVRSRWLVREVPSSAPLEKELAGAGYAPSVRTFATAIGVEEYVPRAPENIVVRRVSDMPTLRDCVSVIANAFPGGRSFTDEELEGDLGNCLDPGSRVLRFVAYDARSGEPLSSGGLTLFPTLAFGFLWAGGTMPHARGRGAYSAVLAARITKARERGCRYAGLYAVTDTSAPIVLRQGFTKFGAMTYWEREP